MTADSAPTTSPKPDPLRNFIEASSVQTFILLVIVINGIVLGLATSANLMERMGSYISTIDNLCLYIFIIEMFIKLIVYRHRYFTDGWNIFDFLIISISVPSLLGFSFLGNISILRAARILRAMRILSIVPQMRQVVMALVSAIPGMASVIVVLMLLFYIAAVMATQTFGGEFPVWFGSIGKSLYSLFQIMTLESWSMGIVRPVMAKFPLAWLFFVPFIIITSFMVLNLFIALIVTSMQNVYDDQLEEKAEAAEADREQKNVEIRDDLGTRHQDLRDEIMSLAQQVRLLRDELGRSDRPPSSSEDNR
ncbi:MAG: ion transporter [Planctomycetota bacterium]|nr:ion transporter [Planctomycetota bacterium]